MKRIYFAAAFLLITISLAIFESYYIGKQTDNFILKIEQSDNYMKEKNSKETYNNIKKIKHQWEENVWTFEIMIHNDNTDKITQNLASLAVYAEKGNIDEYFSSSEKIKEQLTSLKESELLTLKNIL